MNYDDMTVICCFYDIIYNVDRYDRISLAICWIDKGIVHAKMTIQSSLHTNRQSTFFVVQIYIMHLADAFIWSYLQLHSGNTFLISMCVPWDSNPQPFTLLTQCSTTEPHRNTSMQ